MKIQNITNTNFKSVVPIITSAGSFNEIKKDIKKFTPNDRFYLEDCTDYFVKSKEENIYTDAVKSGKRTGFLITGKQWHDSFTVAGWFRHENIVQNINSEPIEIESEIDEDTKTLLIEKIAEN